MNDQSAFRTSNSTMTTAVGTEPFALWADYSTEEILRKNKSDCLRWTFQNGEMGLLTVLHCYRLGLRLGGTHK